MNHPRNIRDILAAIYSGQYEIGHVEDRPEDLGENILSCCFAGDVSQKSDRAKESDQHNFLTRSFGQHFNRLLQRALCSE